MRARHQSTLFAKLTSVARRTRFNSVVLAKINLARPNAISVRHKFAPVD